MQKYNSRAEVPNEYKWDLTDFFKTEEEFQETYDKTNNLINDLINYQGCTKDVDRLHEYLSKSIEAVALWEDLYVYAYLINDQKLGVTTSIERKNKAEKLSTAYNSNTSFFAPELLELSRNEYDKLIKDPKIAEFKEMLERIYREKEHILSPNEEIIISELCTSMNHFDDMSSTLLNSEHNYGKIKIDNETIPIATNNYRFLMKNKNQDIRKKVYNSFNKVLDQYAATNAFCLNSYISMNDTTAKIRKYKDSWDEKLFSNNLEDQVYKTLVKTTEKRLSSLQKYYSLKRKVLGLPSLHPYDTALDMTESDKEYSIEEAQDLILNAIKVLGSDYTKRFDKIFKERHIDYCQYKGKCSGGYSFSTLTGNSRILMSYNGELDSISTIAHEGGHNVHHQYIKDFNKIQYREVSPLVAEVASLTNECLLSSYIADNAKTKDEKLAGIANILGVISSNLFGAVREGKIEQDMYEYVHNGGTLTEEYLDNLTKKSLKKYYGKEIKIDKYSKNGWITRSHYYMNFYLYNYAICISVASFVASGILKGDKELLNNYINFLKVGSDKWPSEAFKILGVDLNSPKVYEGAIDYFDSLVAKFENIYDSEVK